MHSSPEGELAEAGVDGGVVVVRKMEEVIAFVEVDDCGSIFELYAVRYTGEDLRTVSISIRHSQKHLNVVVVDLTVLLALHVGSDGVGEGHCVESHHANREGV